MTIYIDVVFLENLLLNYIILLATAIIAKSKIKYFKFLLASIFGSAYAILNYIIEISTFGNFLLKIFISSFMILVSFENKKLKMFFKNLMMFYLTSFTFGGAAFMLLFFLNPESVVYEGGHFIGTYPLKVAVYGCILGFLIIIVVARFIKNRHTNTLCDLEINYRGKAIKIKTLIDTGNLLKEPISNENVIIVESSSLEEIIDKDVLEKTKDIISGNLIGQMNEKIYKYKFKIIPFSSLGNENRHSFGI